MVQTIYDIIKPHGREIKAETREGDGSEFIIQSSRKLLRNEKD